MLPRTRAPMAVAAVVVAVVGLSVSALPDAVAHPAAARRARARYDVTALTSLDRQIVAKINAVRIQRGLGRLRLSLRLRSAADFHSYEMAQLGYFSHDSADGTSASDRLAQFYSSAGYRRWQVGETLLWYSPDVNAIVAVHEWLTSPDHRTILLAPAFREIGVSAVHVTPDPGALQGQDVTLITADFGVRAR